jgi:hypothetical protein
MEVRKDPRSNTVNTLGSKIKEPYAGWTYNRSRYKVGLKTLWEAAT